MHTYMYTSRKIYMYSVQSHMYMYMQYIHMYEYYSTPSKHGIDKLP